MIKLIKRVVKGLLDCLSRMGDGFATSDDERARRK